MPRFRTEQVTDERTNSIYLSPVDGERGLSRSRESTQVESGNHDHTHPTDKGRRTCTGFLMEGQAKQMDDYVNHSDAASDNSMNPTTLRNDIYAVLTKGELATTGGRTFSTGSTGKVGNLSGSESSSTVTVIRRPVREESVYSGYHPPSSRDTAYPVVQAHERYRGTSYTLDSGFVGPRELCMNLGSEDLGSSSAGLSIRPSTGIDNIPSRGKLQTRGTYRAPDGNYSTSRTDQDRHPSNGSQFQAPGRRVYSGPPPPRSSSQNFPAVPHHPVHGRGSSSGSSYTYGLGGQTNQRAWSTGNGYGSGARYPAPRSHPPGRQQSSGSLSDGSARDTRPRITENYRSPPGNQEFGPRETGDHARYQGKYFRDGSSSVCERRVSSSDPKYRRPRSKAESYPGRRVSSITHGQSVEESEQNEVTAECDEQLAQRTRDMLNRARANIPLPVPSPEGPVSSNVGAQDIGEPYLESIARMIEHQSLPGAVDSEEVPKATGDVASTRAPKLDTTKSLHWSRNEFPEDDSPQSPIDHGDIGGAPDLKRVGTQTERTYSTGSDRFSLDIDDLPESNPTVYNRAQEGFANRSERESTSEKARDGGLLGEGYIPNIWLAASDSPVRKSSGRLRARLVENDNPHKPSSGLPESTTENKNIRAEGME